MSRRYGRNQRRHHREEIAHLRERLWYESAAHMYLPHPGTLNLEDAVRVISFSDEESGGAYDMVERRVVVELVMTDHERLLQTYQDGQPVAFRGHNFMIVNVSVSNSRDQDAVTLELMGVVR